MEEKDLYWLAGILEGEGTFCKPIPSAPNRPIISVQMTDRDVVERIAKMFEVTVCSGGVPKKLHWKKTYRTTIRGQRAVELMKQLYPLMSIRRRVQIENAINGYIVPVKALSNSSLDDILIMLSRGDTHKSIADRYGIHRTTVSHIARGKIPKYVTNTNK